MTAVHDYCPVGDLAGNPHKYPVGTGVVVPWHVAGDPRSGVESCRSCYFAAATVSEHLRFRGYQSAFEDRLWCDECGTLISALDGVATDAGLAFCGSMRGNGCADRLLAEGNLPR